MRSGGEGARRDEEARRENAYAPLAGSLEEEPLEEGVLKLLVRNSQALLGIVFVGEVKEDGVGLPYGEVGVVVVDECGNAPVRVEGRVGGSLLLAFGEVEVDGLVGQAELLKYECNFPIRA